LKKVQINFKFKFLIPGIHPRFKLQFKVYLVPTKPLVVPETIRLLISMLTGHAVYAICQ
jgi:hypothetical protein